MTPRVRGALIVAALAIAAAAAPLGAQVKPISTAERALGHKLVAFGTCNDCHTPGSFLGKRDESRTLGGSDVGFGIPGMGVFVGPNLTPDKETGLGNWTNEQIVTAIRTVERDHQLEHRRALQGDKRDEEGGEATQVQADEPRRFEPIG